MLLVLEGSAGAELGGGSIILEAKGASPLEHGKLVTPEPLAIASGYESELYFASEPLTAEHLAVVAGATEGDERTYRADIVTAARTPALTASRMLG